MGTYSNKVIVITGATSGIGRATAVRLAKEGAKLVLAGRRESEGQNVVDEVKALGAEAIFVKTDVTVEADSENLIQQAIKQFGKVDGAFLNSGVFRFAPIVDQTAEDLTNQIATNVNGVYYGLKHFARNANPAGGAVVINSSVVAELGMPNGTAYSLTKGAVNTLTLGAAVELAPNKIRVNAVAPGPIWTEGAEQMMGNRENFDANLGALVPLGHGGEADDIANAVAYLLSDDAKFVSGTVLNVDGGMSAK